MKIAAQLAYKHSAFLLAARLPVLLMVALAPVVTMPLALDQFLFVLLVASQGLFDHRERGVRRANLFHLHLFAFELFVILEKTFQYQQTMAGKIARFQIFAELGVVGGNSDDFVVGG